MKSAARTLAVLALLAVPIAHAADPIGDISIGGSVGLSSFGLSDVNDRIAVGNDWLDMKGWRTIDSIDYGWSFWSDLKFRVPMVDFLFLSGGYGVSSGSTQGPDSNELISVEVAQEAFHARALYVLPFRFHRDVRLFAGAGPLFIGKQEVRACHVQRSSGGSTGGTVHERTEEVFYRGDGLGWQLGVIAEYMVQDHITLAVDLAYRWANLEYGDWSSTENVIIEDTDPTSFPDDASTSLDRLHGGYQESVPSEQDQSYVLAGFLDEDATRLGEEAVGSHVYGPHRNFLEGISKKDIGIDLSGVQLHIGLRFYFL